MHGYDSLGDALRRDPVGASPKPQSPVVLGCLAARVVWGELPWLGRVLTEITEAEVDGAFDLNRLGSTTRIYCRGAVSVCRVLQKSDR